ncbi:MAG: hypothetical protein DMD81_00010 [Candidatus Rokuibacteriota bacterium]|nr:MAG: hypothetical protein DMD81_00010 [Candidatus Rokubacteria bacterium]
MAVPTNGSPAEPREFHASWLIYAVLAGLLVVLLTTSVFFFRALKLEGAQYLDENDAIARSVAGIIRARGEGHLQILVAYATRFRFRESIEQHDRDGALVELRQLREIFPQLDRIALADPSGVVWAADPPAPALYGRRDAMSDWYRGVSRTWAPYVSEIHRADFGGTLAVALAVPIRATDGRVIGIITSVQRLDTLRRWLLPIEVPDGELFVVDRNGHLVFHRSRTGLEHLGDYARIPAVERVRAAKDGIAELDNPVTGTVSLYAYRWVPTLGWGVVVQREKNVALQRTRTLTLVSAGAALALTMTLATLGGIALRGARHTRTAHRRLEVEIVERRRAEEGAAAANRAKSEFLSRMSHELRTPLNSILGFAQLLEMDVKSPDEEESVTQILKGGRHLLALIDEILDIARIEAGKLSISLEPVSVCEVVQSALDLVRPHARERAVQLTSTVNDDGHVHADRQRLQQVLLNLLSNAIKYNREHGTVTVTSAPAPPERFCLTVSDTGPGIAPAMMDRVFTPFDRLGAEQGGVEGTGLGLALSKRLMEAMGGDLRVTSTPGEGATFTIELPRVEDLPTRELPAGEVVHENGKVPHGTLLYIEDNISNLRLLEHVINRKPGITLLSAMQGRQGVEFARHHRPDLILLDLHLPDISGQEVLERLRDDPRTEKIPVVILSADATPGQITRLLARGAARYLTKPLDVKELLTVLDEQLHERQR